MKFLVVTVLTLISINSQARTDQPNPPGYDTCVKERTIKLETKFISANNCEVGTELSLIEIYKNYSNLNQNPRRVDVWSASFTKDIFESTRYLVQLVDTCRGFIIDEQLTIAEKLLKTKKFNIFNPNVDESISESFMLSPMTKNEAIRALEKARRKCENYNL